jgi:hypothetical protein
MHVFTFGAMGLIIPAMLIRIANGHTGRKVVFDRLDKSVLWIMIAGFVIRIIASAVRSGRLPALDRPRCGLLVYLLCGTGLALCALPPATTGGRQTHRKAGQSPNVSELIHG